MKVTKFGGTSLACASQIRKVKDILSQDEERQIVVASAPGKRFSKDIKVTDLLLALSANHKDEKIKSDIIARFTSLMEELGLVSPIRQELEDYFRNLDERTSQSELVSRGEYFSSKILAETLGFTFLDSKDFLIFDKNDRIDFNKSQKAFSKLYHKGEKYVIPGFYGKDAKGNIHLFSRGGSDITGSYVSAFTNADLYENWTDVSGVFAVNPTMVKNASTLSKLSYQEIRELSYTGANVLHADSVIPCQERNIPICILNTNHPEDEGTLISSFSDEKRMVTGIAGRTGFLSLTLKKRNLQCDANTLYKILHVFDDYHVLIESLASGIDTLTITCSEQSMSLKMVEIKTALEHKADVSVEIESNLSLVSIVSKNLEGKMDIISRIFELCRQNKIQPRLLDPSNDETSVIIGVGNFQLSDIIPSLYSGLSALRLI